ncbi:Thiol-disulfide oxidoreductase ResA [Planctomycetes bacterium Pan216]|uniref:Thiol-disulfide oxidoreductase ResA n=1 Tax=Kolteria novifilia TaxID=2527975 RepID=A0A518BCL1_9BACT|nr:Thiol-disulfide oxidoreductase ResA [Planctomycetes bacterium Pan216]
MLNLPLFAALVPLTTTVLIVVVAGIAAVYLWMSPGEGRARNPWPSLLIVAACALFLIINVTGGGGRLPATGEGIPLRENWRLHSLEDESIVDLDSLSDKVVFINMWATWCGPCVAEMPALQRLYNHFRDDDRVIFLFVTQDQDPSQATYFIAENEYTLPVYAPLDLPPPLLTSSGIPATYILGKGLMLRSRQIGSVPWWDHPEVIELIGGLADEQSETATKSPDEQNEAATSSLDEQGKSDEESPTDDPS